MFYFFECRDIIVTDPAESDQLMADYMHFKRVDVEIARLLGTVISG